MRGRPRYGKSKSEKSNGAQSVNKHFKTFVLAAGLTLLAGIASAGGNSNWDQGGYSGGKPPTCSDEKKSDCREKVSAPEMNPAAMISAVTLLLGSLLVLRGRKAND